MKESKDFWQGDEFEDNVARALIACYESKVHKNKGAAPNDRLSEENLARLRAMGPYIASSSRLVSVPAERRLGAFEFDVTNDVLPQTGCFAITGAKDSKGYLQVFMFRKAETLGKGWKRRAGGQLFELTCMDVRDDSVHGDRSFISVQNDGKIFSCDRLIPTDKGFLKYTDVDPDHMAEREGNFSISAQFIADRRFCWSITANEKIAKATLGCMQEEVKSLLYARSLPLSETGRKRPILHLVEAHKRRMKNGTEVDITAFLRGQPVVEMGGTMFRVNPPQTLRSQVSEPSARHFVESFLPA